ncbi:hypothetical protein Tco_0593479 [Tanacetum coccineum]
MKLEPPRETHIEKVETFAEKVKRRIIENQENGEKLLNKLETFGWLLEEIHVTCLNWKRNGQDYDSTPTLLMIMRTLSRDGVAKPFDGVRMIKRRRLEFLRRRQDDLECEIVMVKMPKCMSWSNAYDNPIGDLDMMKDKVDNPSQQSTLQVLSSFEDFGLNTHSHDLSLSSWEFPSVDELEPQPLPNLPFLDVNLGDKKGTDPPINPYSPGSFRMKAVKPLIIHTPPSPHMAYFH